jgi:hypothetical protein
MKFSALLKNWKVKSRKAKITVWFFAICCSLFLLTPSMIPAAFSTQVTQIAQCRRAQTGDPRSPSNPDIPYIISPRQTLLLTDKPKLRWNQVLGVKSYDVSLQKGNSVVWQTKVNTNEIMYPGKPKLELNEEYLLVVKADKDKFSTDEIPYARGFRLLSAQEAQLVTTAITHLNNQKVPDRVKALQSAFFYIGSDLKSEAIEVLEALINSGVKESYVYRKLGNLYWETGVNLIAETNYLNAHKVAIAQKDIIQQAEIAEALADLYIDIEDQKTALDWLTQARNSYKTLGNTQRVEELDTQLKELKSISGGVQS